MAIRAHLLSVLWALWRMAFQQSELERQRLIFNSNGEVFFMQPGRPSNTPEKYAGLIERISSRVSINKGGCWIWQGEKVKGYGRIRVWGKKVMAHRASYEAHVGPIPAGLHVLHRCDVPSCCNPEHLFVGSRSDNIRDAIAKGRKKPVNGSRVWTSRLSPSAVLEIRRKAGLGEDRLKLALDYGVTRQAIHYIVIRKNWAHI